MNSADSIHGKLICNLPKEVKVLFAALQLRGGQSEQLQGLNDSEWKSLLSFCEMAYLTFPLLKVEHSGFPGWVAEQLERSAADNARRFERIKATYVEVARALEKSGIQYLIMKGFAK
jgi:hypothetical protein